MIKLIESTSNQNKTCQELIDHLNSIFESTEWQQSTDRDFRESISQVIKKYLKDAIYLFPSMVMWSPLYPSKDTRKYNAQQYLKRSSDQFADEQVFHNALLNVIKDINTKIESYKQMYLKRLNCLNNMAEYMLYN